MAANGDAGQDDGIGTYPDVIADDYRIGADALFVDAPAGVCKVVVQGGDGDALRQIDVLTDADRPDDGTVDADAGMVANIDVADGIVDTAERLYDTLPA